MCAVPIDPTATTIVTQALKDAGYKSPSFTQITEAKDYWLERIKNYIWNIVLENGDTRLKTLQHTATTIGTIGSRRIALPADFSEEVTLSLLDGSHTGTVQSGGSSQVVLASDEDITEAEAVGYYYISITGTSKAQYREALTYNATTKALTTAIDWDSGSQPVSGDTYMIIDKHYPVTEQHQKDLDGMTNPTISGRPDMFSKFAEEFYFNKPLDKAYGIRLRYYANLNQVNLTEGSSELITRIYRNWQMVFHQGLLWMIWNNDDDDRDKEAKRIFDQSISNVIAKEIPYGGEFEGFT